MGFLKWLLKHFSCKSNCSFNNEFFEEIHLNRKLSQYSLKNKDIQTIMKILNKRNLKSQINQITEI